MGYHIILHIPYSGHVWYSGRIQRSSHCVTGTGGVLRILAAHLILCCDGLSKFGAFFFTPAVPSLPLGVASLRAQLRANSWWETQNASAHLLLALLPTTGMALIALYIAVYMWKYGNDASIVVQSTICNGWIFLFLGALALLGGQLPPEVRCASLGTPIVHFVWIGPIDRGYCQCSSYLP